MPWAPPKHDPRAGLRKAPVHKPAKLRHLPTNSAQWRAIRAAQLERYPLCAHCRAPANEVDHINGDTRMNMIGVHLQSLCKSCHSRKTAGGNVKGHDESGRPIDPNHPWNCQKSLR